MAGFFDKVVEGINEGVNTGKESLKLMAEKSKLNNQIKDIEREKINVLQALGAAVYELQMSGAVNVEQCSDKFSIITSLNQRSDELKVQLQALEIPKPVQNTYSVPNSQPVPPTAPPVVENGVPCQCGMVNKEGARFCAKCGSPLQ